jgi:hypothetical protein
MNTSRFRRRAHRAAARGSLAIAALAVSGAAHAQGQVTYSIDFHGPTIAIPDSFKAIPITESDILVAPGGTPVLGPFFVPPGATINGGGPGGLGLALYLPCVGHPPGLPCGVEVDALSYGMDGPALPGLPPASWWFSVDQFARGFVAPVSPDVTSEGMLGAREAGADFFCEMVALPPGPLPPGFLGPNRMAVDGNGFRSATYFAAPGLGLVEWNPPMLPPDLGDNVDALDVDFPPVGMPTTFFSLDSAFVDPWTGVPNSASAFLHGFVGGDVLTSLPGGPPALYAPAIVLGLDRVGGPDSDDLDALVLYENGMPGYQPSTYPYDWLSGATDFLLFSVRRGSIVIGAPDCFFGAPIQEGDVLTPPIPGGISPFPGIFVPAEGLGLASARVMPIPFSDDLDGLDVKLSSVFDCNANGQEDVLDIVTGVDPDCNLTGIPDSCDIAFGASYDINANGVPDECELCGYTYYCVAKVNSLGCTPMIGAFGTPSATSAKAFWISAVDVVSQRFGLFFYGLNGRDQKPFQGGTMCVKFPVKRTPIQWSGGNPLVPDCTGVFTFDFNAQIQSGADPGLVPGVTVNGQYWYRDPPSPPVNTGLTDAIELTIGP